MDNPKSSIETLREFARRTHRKVECTEKSYPDVHPITYHRRTLYIPENEFENSYFVCFHDSKEMGNYALFSGVFIPIQLPKTTVAKVRPKDILDKLNRNIKKKSIKTGSNFDSKAVIMGNDPDRIKRIFSNSKIQDLVLKTFDFEEVLNVAINEPEFEFVPGLRDNSYFGIFTTQNWIEDKQKIEKLFGLAEEFGKHF